LINPKEYLDVDLWGCSSSYELMANTQYLGAHIFYFAIQISKIFMDEDISILDGIGSSLI